MQSAYKDAPDPASRPLKSERASFYLLWLIWVAWIPFFIPVLVGLFQSNPAIPRLYISLGGIIIFFGIYLWASWLDARYLNQAAPKSVRAPARVWIVLGFLTSLAVLLILLNGGNGWLGLFYYLSGYAGARLSTFRTATVILGLLLIAGLTGLLSGADLSTIGQGLLFIGVIGIIIMAVGQVFLINQQLRLAREEIARLAITAERLRIARDLHDLLGHNLSLITLKSELAGRLIAVKPEYATREIRDIEQVARTTLQEVREAVSSYRQPTLISELQAARDILTAAGISYKFEGKEEILVALPAAIETALAWSVREGVTNVIKHSRARHCLITIRRDQSSIQTEIIDDGAGYQENLNFNFNQPGNGLRGLTERVTALEGQLTAAPDHAGGFRLAVSLPFVLRKNAATDATGSHPAHQPAQDRPGNLDFSDFKRGIQ